jgi:hypothetical protein
VVLFDIRLQILPTCTYDLNSVDRVNVQYENLENVTTRRRRREKEGVNNVR